ncbi:MAG: response regulator [Anaerolineae bacterium]|nr:response regulator [Anaerolineae bacterium]
MSDTHGQAPILVVDDNEQNCLVLQLMLSDAGFENVIAVRSGQAALDRIARKIPQLILLDVMMPTMDGYQVTEIVRSQYPEQFIPIILVSALEDPQERMRGIRAGANDFISKPYDKGELMARIDSLLERKRILDELAHERERLALLYMVSQALTSQLDYQQIIQKIVSLTTELTGAAKAILVLLDANGNFRQKIISRAGKETRSTDTIDPLVLSKGLLGWVICHTQPVLIPDISRDERWMRFPDDDEPTCSVMAAPLVKANRATGALMLSSPEPDRFEARHLDMLVAICNQAAVALENARLYERAHQERARIETLLNQMGDPVVVTDMDGNISQINPSTEREFRLDDSVIGKPLAEVFDLALADLLLRAQERGTSVSGEYTTRKLLPDAHRSYHVSVSPVEEIGYTLIWQDISGLKESERVRLETERAEKQHVIEAFSRYMSPALLERVLNDPDIMHRRELQEAVVVFADLRGFTQLTVEHSPDAVMALLNKLFPEMIEIVHQYEGVIFDITGDELMIAFNVPYTQEDANQRAVSTAIDMQHRFARLKTEWATQNMMVGLGVGIARGPVVLGHVGGPSHMNYAMVGEAVNIAHRLVDLAKDAQIVVSPDILADAKVDEQRATIQKLPPKMLKGKAQAVPLILIEATITHTQE